MRMRAGLTGLLMTTALACLASEEDLQQEFASYVAGASACAAATECAIATTDCPLGCSHAVRADRKADVENKGRELVARYQRGGRRCDYECVVPGPLACVAGRCTFASDAPDAGPDR
jgi:hypothetical protein